MPASPRIWPSIRFSLFRQDVLISWRIGFIYPHRVYYSRQTGAVRMAHADHAHGEEAAGHRHGSALACGGGDHEKMASPEAEVAIDPVCGMKVKRETAKHRLEYDGTEYL